MSNVMNMKDIVDMVVSGDNVSEHGHVFTKKRGNLTLLCYTGGAHFEGEWNYLERVSRGLIINNMTGEIVARPFDKFFNWLQGGRVAKGHIVNITEKVDGSLGIMYRNNGYHIATKGSFDSEQAVWATKFLNENYDLSGLDDSLTLLFEIIYPSNRIVVNYGDTEDLVLLAARNRLTGKFLSFYPDLYNMAHKLGFTLPKTYDFNSVADLIEMTGRIDEDQEGFVAEFSDGSRFKFKGDRYLELHKAVTNMSYKKTVMACMNNNERHILNIVPDEFLDDYNRWVREIHEEVDRTTGIVRDAMLHAPKDNRKQFALWVQERYPRYQHLIFAAYDGKEIEPLIYKEMLE